MNKLTFRLFVAFFFLFIFVKLLFFVKLLTPTMVSNPIIAFSCF